MTHILPDISSLVKQKRRLPDSEEYVSEYTIDNDPMFSGKPYGEKLNSFPTSGHQV